MLRLHRALADRPVRLLEYLRHVGHVEVPDVRAVHGVEGGTEGPDTLLEGQCVHGVVGLTTEIEVGQEEIRDLLGSQQLGPILAEINCRFKVPITYPDTLHIGTYITDLKADRFTQKYVLISEAHNCIAAEGEGRVVCYDFNRGQKADLPADMLEKLKGHQRAL